jgi:hypothetical protein
MKFTIRVLVLLFLILVFLSGFLVFLNNGINGKLIEEQEDEGDEGMQTVENLDFTDSSGNTGEGAGCPDLLVKKGNALLLYNTKKIAAEGTNPIQFANLDEYISYLETNRKTGAKCPILFLQEETDVQGKDVFRMRPSPFDQAGGLPPVPLRATPAQPSKKAVKYTDATRENPPFNKDQYMGFDPTNMYVGKYTTLDEIHNSTAKQGACSDNQMDENWCGVSYTQSVVDSGKYRENEVYKVIYPK